MSALNDYSCEVVEAPRERERILALWRQGLTHAGRPEAKYDWYYGRNPAGEPLVVFLCHGEGRTAVGTASTGKRLLRTRDGTVLAGILLDFVVAADHRTLFPAMALQREMKRVADATFDTVYGFPNRNSEAAIKRQGFVRKASLVRHALVLRTADYIARRAPASIARLAGPVVDTLWRAARAARGPRRNGIRPAWQERPDARFDDLWRRCAGVSDVIGVRDAAFLAWRFADYPFGRNEFFTLASAQDGRLLAYAACQSLGSSLKVNDFLADPAEPGVRACLWRELSRAADARGHANLSVEFCGDEDIHRDLHDAGFRVRSERPFYVSRSSPLADARWYVTAADEDA